MRARLLHAFATPWRMPAPSAPSTMATGPSTATACSSVSSAAPSSPITVQPASVSASIAREMFTARISSTVSIAPVAAFASAPPAVGALRVCITMPATPNAAADRKIAPTFCGSVTWSRIASGFSGRIAASAMSIPSSGRQRTASPWCTAPGGSRSSNSRASIRLTKRGNASRFSPARSAALRVISAVEIFRIGLESTAAPACWPQIQTSPFSSNAASRRSCRSGRPRCCSGLRPGGRGPPGLAPGRGPSRIHGLSARPASAGRPPSSRAGRSGVRSLRGRSGPPPRDAPKPPDFPPFPGRLRGRSFVTIRRAPR